MSSIRTRTNVDKTTIAAAASSSKDSSSSDKESQKAKLPPIINLKLAESKERQPPPQDAQEWGARKIIKRTDMSKALVKLAANNSNAELYNTVLTTTTLLPFAVIFSGPYVEVVHSFGMFRNFLKPDGK